MKVRTSNNLIHQNISKLQGKKNGTSLSFLDLSQDVNPLVQNSNHLLEDLRRLNQLKENKNHDDLDQQLTQSKTSMNKSRKRL